MCNQQHKIFIVRLSFPSSGAGIPVITVSLCTGILYSWVTYMFHTLKYISWQPRVVILKVCTYDISKLGMGC